jgi:hypothetical protein
VRTARGRRGSGTLPSMNRGFSTPDDAARPSALDCVVCGDRIALDEEVVVVWKGAGDVPTAVSLARCQDELIDRGDRTSGPYPLRAAITDIVTAARARGSS